MTIEDDQSLPVVARRTIAAPRDKVFAAWLDPALLVRFMRPSEKTMVSAEVEARVGGHYRIVMNHGLAPVEHRGEYLEITRPSRLSFTWQSVNTEGRATLVVLEFNERPDGTEVVLTHTRLPLAMRDAHFRGWTAILGELSKNFGV